MAELPDLTVFVQILNNRFKGKMLNQVQVKLAKKLNTTVLDLKAAIEGKTLANVTREGKTIHFHFLGEQVLSIHLMLKGELLLLENDIEPKYEIMGFNFSDGTGFALVDMLKQATPTLNPKPSKIPDALGKDMDLAYFTTLLNKKRTIIKTLLMDQHLIRGIGNSYADEILWHARISPLSIANAIPDVVVKCLYNSINDVLQEAIKQLAKKNGNELRGELRDFMKIHGSALEKSPTGKNIMSTKIGGRISYYTDEQELYK